VSKPPSSSFKVLILTASMGEGHNTAAKNIRDGILAINPACEVLVADPYTRTNPVINKLVQSGYTMAINRYPRAWKVVFKLLNRRGFVEGMGPMLTELTSAVRGLINEFQPDVIASTYPVFSFLMAKIRKADASITAPFYTVITDSTEISSAWYRCPCDGVIVADEPTAAVVAGDGVPRERIHVLGFPVGLAFEDPRPCAPPADGIWKALFFPGGTSSRVLATLEGLAALPNVSVDVITGRRTRMLAKLQAAGLPKRGTLAGWTDRMAELMSSHHLFIGKAGGATVQETIAAQIPFLVSHVVPGQEEGNISLIQQTGIGALASASPTQLCSLVQGALANDAAVWRAWRANLAALQKPSASRVIGQFLIDRCSN